jgi:hypothetical protein
MNLTSRDRKAVVVGGIIAGLILVISYVVAPLARAWFRRGTELGPKLEYVDRLRERVHGQESLFDRREVLVRRLGSLLGQEAPVVRARSMEPIARVEQAAAATPTASVAGPAGRITEPTSTTPTARIAGSAAAGERENPVVSEVAVASTERAAASAGRPASGVSLAAHVERTAKKAGVKIERISPKRQSRARRGTRHFDSVALQVRIESDMQNLIKLLYGLEKGERFVRVEQMQLRRDLKKGDAMKVSLDVVGYEAAAR